MTHTEGDTDPTPERRWTIREDLSVLMTPEYEWTWLVLPKSMPMRNRILATLNEAETLRAELAAHQFIEWQATVDRDRALVEAETLRAELEIWGSAFSQDKPVVRALLADSVLGEHVARGAIRGAEALVERVRELESRLQRTAKVYHGLHWRSSAGNGTFEECQFDECEAARRALTGADGGERRGE